MELSDGICTGVCCPELGGIGAEPRHSPPSRIVRRADRERFAHLIVRLRELYRLRYYREGVAMSYSVVHLYMSLWRRFTNQECEVADGILGGDSPVDGV